MKWNNKYLIGIKEVDNQHKRLVECITRFKDSISDEKKDTIDEMGKVLGFLVNYTNYHFESEEALMERIGYPELEEHKAIHRDLVTELKKILIKLKSKESYKPIEFYYFLMKWLTEHIEDEDNKIGKYYKDNNKEVKLLKSALESHEYVLSVFEPNITRLNLMIKNKLITNEDALNKKKDFIVRFYNMISVPDISSLIMTLSSVSLLYEKGYVSDKEQKDTKQYIFNNIQIEDIIKKEEDIAKKMEMLKFLYDEELISGEYYSIAKTELIDVM